MRVRAKARVIVSAPSSVEGLNGAMVDVGAAVAAHEV